MRIIDDTGKWDIPYESVALKMDGNRLYAYPLFTNVIQKPIYLHAFTNEKDGIECLMSMRYAIRCGAKIYNLSKKQFQEELDYYESQISSENSDTIKG